MPAAPRVANALSDPLAAAPGRKRRERPWAEEEAAAMEAWRENGGLPGSSSGVLRGSTAGGASPASGVVVHLDPTGLSPLDDSVGPHGGAGGAGSASTLGSQPDGGDAADLLALFRVMNGAKRRRTAGRRRAGGGAAVHA